MTSTPRLASALLLTAACALLSAGCGDDDAAPAARSAPEASATKPRTFVGEIGGPDRLIAVVTEGAGADRTVRAYICSRTSRLTEWFRPQPVAGGHARLTSDGGHARLDVTLADDGASGTVVLDGARASRFTAPPARGIGGLYDVRVASDGSIVGRDEVSGTTTRGRVGPRTTMEVTFAPHSGGTVRVPGSVTTAVAGPGQGRLIHLDPDGLPGNDDDVDVGVVKAKAAAGGTSAPGYTWWSGDMG